MTEVRNKVEYRDITTLEKWEDNPRTISKKELDSLKASIKEDPDYFEGRPILLSDRTGKLVIIAGNQRYEAAKALGLKEVPTVLYHCKTEEEEVRRAMRDNHNNGEWDIDMIANKFSDYPLDDWLGSDWDKISSGFELEDTEIVEDDAPEVDESEPPKSEPGKVYKLGNHRLMCGDSTSLDDMQKLMDGQLADLVLTDPPYNVDYQGGTGLKIQNDKQSDQQFHEFLYDAFTAMDQSMKSGAAFYIWHADSEGYNFRSACKEAGWTVRECLIWNKDSLVLGRQDYQWKHEPCLYGWKDGDSHQWYNDRKQTTVIDWDRPRESKEHPTMKPVGLFGYLIQNSSKGDDIVLDSFGGSGTTIIACEQLGRKGYSMELDPKYCDVIRKRWWKLTHDGNEEGWEEGTPEA